MLDSFNPAWIAAAAAVCTALIAWRASSNWRKGLENERIDNALSALHDFDARIDRVVALRGDKEHVWNAYHELWDSRSRFNQAYVVAQRYHRRLRLFNAPKNFVTCLHELRDIVKDGCSDEDAKKFKKKVDDLVEATTNKLNEPRRKRGSTN
jgi:hypothetical protein